MFKSEFILKVSAKVAEVLSVERPEVKILGQEEDNLPEGYYKCKAGKTLFAVDTTYKAGSCLNINCILLSVSQEELKLYNDGNINNKIIERRGQLVNKIKADRTKYDAAMEIMKMPYITKLEKTNQEAIKQGVDKLSMSKSKLLERTNQKAIKQETVDLNKLKSEIAELKEEIKLDMNKLEEVEVNLAKLKEVKQGEVEIKKTELEKAELEEAEVKQMESEIVELEKTESEETEREEVKLKEAELEETKSEIAKMKKAKSKKIELKKYELNRLEGEATELSKIESNAITLKTAINQDINRLNDIEQDIIELKETNKLEAFNKDITELKTNEENKQLECYTKLIQYFAETFNIKNDGNDNAKANNAKDDNAKDDNAKDDGIKNDIAEDNNVKNDNTKNNNAKNNNDISNIIREIKLHCERQIKILDNQIAHAEKIDKLFKPNCIRIVHEEEKTPTSNTKSQQSDCSIGL